MVVARETLCAAVVLVDDRTEPLHHLVLDVDRARGRRVDHASQARHVVRLTHRVGQLEHPHEHGRHELGVRDAVVLDEPQHGLGVELAHQDRRGADPVYGHRVVDPRRVIQRRRRQVHARRGHVVALRQRVLQDLLRPRSLAVRRAADAAPPWAARWCPRSRASPSRPRCGGASPAVGQRIVVRAASRASAPPTTMWTSTPRSPRGSAPPAPSSTRR